jgi:uncharacterized membrane protein YfcA
MRGVRVQLVLFLTGIASGAVNSISGGGTFLAFPVLIGVAGLPTVAANASCTVGLLPGMLASTGGYLRDLFAHLRTEARRQLLPSAVGGALGAWLLLALGERVFAEVVPWLLIVSAALIAAQPLINRWLVKHRPEQGYAAASIVVPFLVSVYGGYFGAAQGIAFVAGMGLLLPRPMSDLNALRILNAMVNTVLAALTFIVLEARHPTGAVDLHAAVPLGVGSLLGGWVGVRIVRRMPSGLMRIVMAAVGLAIGVYLAVRR